MVDLVLVFSGFMYVFFFSSGVFLFLSLELLLFDIGTAHQILCIYSYQNFLHCNKLLHLYRLKFLVSVVTIIPEFFRRNLSVS